MLVPHRRTSMGGAHDGIAFETSRPLGARRATVAQTSDKVSRAARLTKIACVTLILHERAHV